jgi:hypothetical protein
MPGFIYVGVIKSLFKYTGDMFLLKLIENYDIPIFPVCQYGINKSFVSIEIFDIYTSVIFKSY